MIRKLIRAMRQSGWVIHTQAYRLNILGIRANSTIPNSFDDAIHVFYKNGAGKWVVHSYRCTTDPGTFWLRSPMHPQGTAILKQGQYDSYGISRHRDKYYALCQINGDVDVIRDYNRDSILDFRNGRTMSGRFGINIHRASAYGTTKEVERYSAGCQVFSNAGDFEQFMQLCENHKRLYGNQFTYSLLDFRAVRRAGAKRAASWAAIGVGAATIGILTYSILNHLKEKKHEFH